MCAAGLAQVYVDCKAIAPGTAARVKAIIERAGAAFIDAGIIGAAPGKRTPRFYVSGDNTQPVEMLDGCGFRVVTMAEGGYQGSAIKMCSAGLTKGAITLHF